MIVVSCQFYEYLCRTIKRFIKAVQAFFLFIWLVLIGIFINHFSGPGRAFGAICVSVCVFGQ